jgi:hypothetical protein
MRDDVLGVLKQVGCLKDPVTGLIRLYHATSREAADLILAEGKLRPSVPTDPAERQLMRGGGSVFLASQPSILEELVDAAVILAVDVLAAAVPAEVIRPRWGTPPRAELEVRLNEGLEIDLAFADELGRDVGRDDLTTAVQAAINLFQASDVGQQLRDPSERPHRCRRASERFVSAIRHIDPDSRAQIMEWKWGVWFHNAVVVADSIIVDWTASQFIEDPDAIAAIPWPLITTRAKIDLDMSLRHPTPAGTIEDLPPTGQRDFLRRDRARILPWGQVQGRIPAYGTPEAEAFKN